MTDSIPLAGSSAASDAPLAIPHGHGAIDALVTEPSTGADAWATVVLAHGAGAGKDHPFMVGAAHGLVVEGLRVVRFDFPYITAGRRFPDRAPAALAAWRSVADVARGLGDVPLVAAGKSFGGRMASMAVSEGHDAGGMDAAALVYLGYPLHAPGKPERLRDEHLDAIAVPQLFLQGTNDPFATGDLLDGVVARLGASATLDWLEGAGHSFEVKGAKRPQDEIGASLAPRIAAWLREALVAR